ncbi:alpha-1A adrenergic receptor-like [Asterias amurensis]|uniref:alpha-1A adrenergic receptor-like n=1 Tax=Asterias amurensis TaxID=7602 RepID=UPI003AB46CB9
MEEGFVNQSNLTLGPVFPPRAIPSSPLIGLEVFLGSVGLVGNALVCITIWHSKTLHTLTNYLILNLAIADFLISLCAILNPWLIWEKFSSTVLPMCYTDANIDSYLDVQVYSLFHRIFTDSSPLCLLLVTLERFVGIVQPLKHPTFFSTSKTVILLLLTWAVPFLLEIPAGLWFIVKYIQNNCMASNARDEPGIITFPVVSSVIAVIVPALIMVYMYIVILRNLKRSARNLEEQGIHGPPQELHRAHQKVVNTLVLVTIVFIVLIFPCRVIYIYTVVSLVPTAPQPVVLQQIVLILGVLNSGINPVVYGFKYDKFRRAFIDMMCCCCKRSRDNAVHTEMNATRGTQSTDP